MTGGGAEMVAGAVVQRLAGMLANKAWQRIELLWNFKEDVQDIENKMADLKVALSYADRRSRESADDQVLLVQHWLKRYKSVAYDIEDVLDELVANATIWENSRCTVKLFSPINPLFVRITMSNKMTSIRRKLDKIVEGHKKFPVLLLPSSTSQDGNKKQSETFIGERDEIEMVGRENERRGILTKMIQKYKDQKSSIIIPVVGLGGIGKTTLAKVVYTDKETNMFDVKAWVHVSKDFELSKIVSAIISQVENKCFVNNADLQYLKSQLDRILCEKFYLIVLDDLWEEGRTKLEELMNMLQSGKKGSSIIITTRSEKVSSTLSTIYSPYFHTADPIKLESMSVDECWSIMKPRNLRTSLPNDLVIIGKGIAHQCSGIPLVAKALGFVMQKHCTTEEWLKIKNSNILDIKDDDKGILKGLLLSYHHMPLELKLCFTYCSIFPKSHDIDYDRLIQQWIALGFIQGADGQQLRKLGAEYVDEFMGMSFLNILTSPTESAARLFKPTLKLRMHDMVHDLARYVAADEFSCTSGATNFSAKNAKLNCHYHLLIHQNETSTAYKAFPKKARALHSRGCDGMHLPKQAFSHMLYLRVLDLSGCHLSDLPSSVYNLKLLKYLDASNLPISRLPRSLNRLLNLQTLVLSNTSLNTLPTDIGCLQKLQYFDLSRCVNLREIPISFGNLSALLFLNLASCLELHTLPESFGNLHRLQLLNLSNCCKLHSLPESCCQLHDLTHLDLSDCHNLEQLPDCIGQLSKLEYLNVTSCPKVQILPDSLCKLMMLRHLNLSFCVYLECLPSSIGDLGLQSLDLQCCFSLGGLPDSIFNMSTLRIIEAELAAGVKDDVQELRESLNLQGSSKLDGGSGDLWIQIAELDRTLCHKVEIIGLENVDHLAGADQGKLSTNSNLTKLFLRWEYDEGSLLDLEDAATAKSVLAKLLPPRSLQHLDLRGYIGIDFPRWMMDISSYLPHLTSIYLIGVHECNWLPPLGRLPNLRAIALIGMSSIKNIGREFYGDYGRCQKLRVIYLKQMYNLEEWWTMRSSNGDGEFLIPNLHLLAAWDCPKLKFVPYPPRSMAWMLENSHHVLPENGFGTLSSSTSPIFLGIGSLSSEGWRRTQHLSSIECLELDSATGLRNLPDVTRCFKSLQKLRLRSCADLETLPEWLGDFTSLREIRIEECPKLSLLPESIGGLTKLKKLRIINCPELFEKCQGEDKHKVAHIPEVTSD